MKVLLLSNERWFNPEKNNVIHSLRCCACPEDKGGNTLICRGYEKQHHIAVARFSHTCSNISIFDLLLSDGQLKDYVIQPYFISTDLHLLEVDDNYLRLYDIDDKNKTSINIDSVYTDENTYKLIIADIINPREDNIKVLKHLKIQRGQEFEGQELPNDIVEYIDDNGKLMFRYYFYEGIILPSGKELKLYKLPEHIKKLGFDEIDEFAEYINSYEGHSSDVNNTYDCRQIKSWGEKQKIRLLKYVGDRLQKSRQIFNKEVGAYITVDVNKTDFVVKVAKKKIGRDDKQYWNTYDCKVLYEEQEILAEFVEPTELPHHTLCIVKASELKEFNNSENNINLDASDTIEEMKALSNKTEKHCKDCRCEDCCSAGPNGDGRDDAYCCPNFTY